MNPARGQSGKISMKALVGAIIIGLVASGIYFLTVAKNPGSRAAKDAMTYIDALQKRDFETVFKYNGASQRRRAIILRSEGDRDRELKELFEEQKKSFEEAVPVADMRAQWVEKFLFVPGGTYKLGGVELVKDTENPSQPASERTNAIVTIEASYPDKNTAPDLNGKVKSAAYQLMMVQAKNISRVLRGGEVKDNRWLFLSASVRQGSIQYW